MDWQVGDLAVCVDASKHANSDLGKPPLEEGCVYTVVEVHNGMRGLEVAEAPCAPAIAFKSSRFRKITPDSHEACEEEFVTLLKRTKRTVAA